MFVRRFVPVALSVVASMMASASSLPWLMAIEPFTAAVSPPVTPAPTETTVSWFVPVTVTATPSAVFAVTSLPTRYAPVVLPR